MPIFGVSGTIEADSAADATEKLSSISFTIEDGPDEIEEEEDDLDEDEDEDEENKK